MLVRGFHGTSAERAEVILSKGFELSRNEYDWLGDGVYFFQDAPERAWEWATQIHGEKAAVICSEISLEDCMDLLDITWFQVLNEAYNLFLNNYKQLGKPLPTQSSGAHRLDREVINYTVSFLAAEKGINIRSIRAVFKEGIPVFPNSSLFNRDHIQIAVRDTILIKKSWEMARGDNYVIGS